jgi:hypothetical protein
MFMLDSCSTCLQVVSIPKVRGLGEEKEKLSRYEIEVLASTADFY